MSKLWIAILSLVVVVSNALWLYVVVDSSISLTYMEASHDSMAKAYGQAIVLANLDLKGLSAPEAARFIGNDVYGSDPFIKEGCLYVGPICLNLNENNVIVGIGNNDL